MAVDEQDQRSLAPWAADCAEHVLGLFEAARPGDDRPRRAVDAARAWARARSGSARRGPPRSPPTPRRARPTTLRLEPPPGPPVTPWRPPTWPVTRATRPRTPPRPRAWPPRTRSSVPATTRLAPSWL